MSEKITVRNEAQKNYERELLKAEHEVLLPEQSAVEKAKAEQAHKASAHEARKAIHEAARHEILPQLPEAAIGAEKTSQPVSARQVSQELKQITLRRELNAIRRKLPAPQRALSRIIHQPVVRAISNGASQTVSRPSGLLGGGLFALVGSSAYLYLAKHVGFRYNYGVFLLFFGAGFILGLILELAVYAATAKQRKMQD